MPGVVDEDVERPEVALDLGEHGAHLGAVGHVGLERAVAPALELGDRLLRGGQADVVDDDPRALLGEALGDGAAETRSALR